MLRDAAVSVCAISVSRRRLVAAAGRPAMPNLDVKVLRYMSNEEFRVLTAVEMGMKNHEIVPSSLIESISGLKRGGAFKLIRLLAKNKLVGHQSKPYDGYRLTSKGYDYLALKTLCKRGAISAVGIQIGVGKESDIFTAVRPDGEEVALKLHKLGRSFRTLKNNRDYTRPGQSFNWLYMSRLSALKEFAFMSALHSKGFSVPTPIDVNRHVVVMSLAHGYQLNSIRMLRHPASVFNSLMVRAARPPARPAAICTEQQGEGSQVTPREGGGIRAFCEGEGTRSTRSECERMRA
jgi:RIO kinase 2